MRVCLVYDCLYPYTVGGAERWYGNLAEALIEAGHDVTHLTRRQWEAGVNPARPGLRIIAVSPRDELYDAKGFRRTSPPLKFGRGVLGHLARHRNEYDLVHTCAFPFFSLLAARGALVGTHARLSVDWFEVWSKEYWLDYLGPVGGRIGYAVQRACVRLTPQAFVFSRLHASRLAAEGLRQPPIALAGLVGPGLQAHGDPSAARYPLVVFAGRHIPEKRVEAIPAAIEAGRRTLPGLRALVLGDGPRREALLAEISARGLEGVVSAPGFLPVPDVQAALEDAACLVLPSSREGYGLVVVEAAAAATPSVVVKGVDNAAVELVEEGVNGTIAESVDPSELGAALVRAVQSGPQLRQRTAEWFAQHAPELRAERSAQVVLDWAENEGRPG